MNKKALTIIFVTVFIDLLGFGVLIPVLPTFASKVIKISDFQIGIVVATFSFMQFLFNPVLGRLSDKIGRKPVILASLLTTATSYVIFAFTRSFGMLLLSRGLAGIGGSNIGVAQAYIADVTTREERSGGMGIIGAAFGLGFVFGPLLGGILSEYGYSAIGFTSAAFSFTALTFAVFALPESRKKAVGKIKFTLSDFKLIEFKFLKEITKTPFVAFLMALFFIIVFSVANIYGTFALLGYKVYHFTDRQNGYLFGVMGFVSAVIQLFALKKLSLKFGERTLLLVGTLFMGFGLALLPYGGGFYGVALISALLTLGTALLQPVVLSLISKYSPSDIQGGILGVNQSVSALARVLGPLWGGWAFEYWGYEYPFLTGAFFTFVSFLLVFFILTNSRLEKNEEKF
jgi:MFS family permease